ncbi:MAG: hypothetical protein K9G38_03405 [Bacteroidales bacterium]|nr:hypothetical protein [Bacteroidales bacterium]
MKRNLISAILILIVISITGVIASVKLLELHHPYPLYPSEGLTSTVMLSDYLPALKGTNGDTKIYFFDSGKPGATVMLGGGTHPNEPAGYMASVLVMENIMVDKGRVIVIPRMNNSGFTCTDPMEAYPQSFTIKGDSGKRTFRMGSRGTNPLDQWPDPIVFSHPQSGQQFSGLESRNLNRNYPGKPKGTITQKVAYAITQLIIQEDVTIAFDLHEAAPEIPIINAIVYHERSEDIAMYSILELEFENLKYAPEMSPINFHGLSHREWGDYTDTYPFLMETSSPVQGRIRGKTNEAMILNGYSENYKIAKETGALRIVYRDEGEQLDHRVGRHVAGFKAITNSYNLLHPENTVTFSGLPDYSEITENGIGNYLNYH